MTFYDGLFEELENNKDAKQAEKMSAYMQNKFEFYGIPKPKLALIMKPYLKESKKYDFDWDFVNMCWDSPYREAQYIAIEYILKNKKNFGKDDLPKIKNLIVNKSWWETVDSLDAVCGVIVQKNPDLKDTMLNWSKDDNIWLRRVAIDFQQEYKEETDTKLLTKIIENNFNSKEFFINKAIGWSLRDYSKVNPNWVREFLNTYKDGLVPLTKKEAAKYL